MATVHAELDVVPPLGAGLGEDENQFVLRTKEADNPARSFL